MKTHFPSHPFLPCPFLGWPDGSCYVVAMYPRTFPSFQKLSVAAASKPRQNLASRRSVEPIKRHPALGPLPPVCFDPLKFPCTPPSGYRRIGFYHTFFSSTKKVSFLFAWHILALLRNRLTQSLFLTPFVTPHITYKVTRMDVLYCMYSNSSYNKCLLQIQYKPVSYSYEWPQSHTTARNVATL